MKGGERGRGDMSGGEGIQRDEKPGKMRKGEGRREEKMGQEDVL